jgi:hypothetical protein
MRQLSTEVVQYYIDVSKAGVLVFRAQLGDHFAHDERAADVILNDTKMRYPASQGWLVQMMAFNKSPAAPPPPPKPTVDSLIAAASRRPQVQPPVSDGVGSLVASVARPVTVPEPTGAPIVHHTRRTTTPPPGALGLETDNEDRPADVGRRIPPPVSQV